MSRVPNTSSSTLDKMRAAFRSSQHRRNSSLSTVPPPRTSSDYSPEHASIAASILYRSPLPSQDGLPIYILNAAAFPDAFEVDYDTLLAYVLARLPGEDELLAGEDYEIIFFAGGQPDSATSEKKTSPGVGWYLQTYHVLSRAVRKRLKRLYVVHERSWVRVLIQVFGTIVSPKFKKKIIHVHTLSGLAMHMPIEQLLIPPSVYLHDRRIVSDIYAPYVSGRRAFAADQPLPVNLRGEKRLPRVLRETTTFLCQADNIKTEGLFRIPAHSQLSGILREAYDRGQKYIVWKEQSATWAQPGMDPAILREVHPTDAYGVHLAAGLIKLWYRELKTPIFDSSCYAEVRQRFSSVDEEITLVDLVGVFSPASSDSFLTPTARQILTLHLMPLLALVVRYHSANKMTAENIAICFSPAMVHGVDQLADAKMTSIIRRILESAIEAWPRGLREACNITDEDFAIAISPPRDPQDYEDPLHETLRSSSRNSAEDEPHRIVLRDDDAEEDPRRPSLPPRPRVPPKPTSFPVRQDSLSSPVKRKPAPPVSVLPMYSQAIGGRESILTASPVEGVSPITRDHIGSSEDIRKPNTAGARSQSLPQPPLSTIPATLPPSQDDLMKELKASLVADTTKRKPVILSDNTPSPTVASPEKSSNISQTRSASDTMPSVQSTASQLPVFARPTWAASSRQSSLPSATRPETSSKPPTPTNTSTTPTNLPTPGPAFKVKAPSPGLLKRMTSMDLRSAEEKQRENERLLPQGLGLKKASVDDLRRLYEERATTVSQLNSTSASRRSSNAGVAPRRTSSAGLA